MAGGLQHLVSSSVARSICRQGFAVIDGAFSVEVRELFRKDILMLRARELMNLNCTHLVKDNTTKLLPKSNIFEAELTFDKNVQAAAPNLSQLAADRTLATMLSMQLGKMLLDSQTMKVQYSAGRGACFPLHWDSDEQLDARRITALLYLNPSWQPQDGGVLRLYPWPAPPVDVEPLDGRLVLFSSTRMLHRVLPTVSPGRLCLTIWLSDTRKAKMLRPTPPSLSNLLRPVDLATAWAALVAHPVLYQAATKLVYVEEWYQSLLDSHPSTLERTEMLSRFEHEVSVMKGLLADYVPYISQMTEKPDVALIRANPPAWLPR